jgi:bifunctional DNA-binding transcriptional regulator/antitoxin component of YhaV-PrlF toxin-antitoxin module
LRLGRVPSALRRSSCRWRAGDDVVIRASGQGRIEVERAEDLVLRFAGSLPAGTYPTGYLDELRGEWRE